MNVTKSMAEPLKNPSGLQYTILMYLKLHPPKHEKLHPYEKFHFVNTWHLHIGQWVSKFFILKSKSCTYA